MDEDNTPDLREMAEFTAEQQLKAAVEKLAELNYTEREIAAQVTYYFGRYENKRHNTCPF